MLVQIKSGWGLARVFTRSRSKTENPQIEKLDIDSDEAKAMLAAAEQDFDQAITTSGLQAGPLVQHRSSVLELNDFAEILKIRIEKLEKRLVEEFGVPKDKAEELARAPLRSSFTKIEDPDMADCLAKAINCAIPQAVLPTIPEGIVRRAKAIAATAAPTPGK